MSEPATGTAPPRPRLRLGIWAAWNHPVNFVGEGMAHMVAMLAEGAAEGGRVTLHLAVRPANLAAARAMLEGLHAREGEDWVLHAIEDAAAERAGPPSPPRAEAVARARLPDRTVGAALFLAGLASLPLTMGRALLRPAFRFAWAHGLRVSVAALRDPAGAAPEVAAGPRRLTQPGMRRLADGLAAWSAARRAATAGAAPAAPRHDPPGAAAPAWRVRGVGPGGVDAWLSLMPDMVVPEGVPGRRAMLVPDVITMEFTAGWNPAFFAPGGFVRTAYPGIRRNAAACDAILTFSEHVARRHVVEGFGADPAKLRIVPHAPPDVRGALPFLPPAPRRAAATRVAAAGLLRAHAARQGLSYLADFPFEAVDYLAVSTQERPSKNLPALLEAFRILVQERGRTLKLLMTTVLWDDPASPNLRLLGLIRRHGLALDALSVPRLPKAEHAALFHAAALTVHPAFFEGGDAPFPFSESVGVGTPCLMGRGPHTEELLGRHPDLAPFVFDPYDVGALVAAIERGLAERDAMLEAQEAVHARMRRRRWAEVAEEYAAAASGIPLVPVRRLIPPGEGAASAPAGAAASGG